MMAGTAGAVVLAWGEENAAGFEHANVILAGAPDAASAGAPGATARLSGLAARNAGACNASRATCQAEIRAALEAQRTNLGARCSLGTTAHVVGVAIATAALVIAATRGLLKEGIAKVLDAAGGSILPPALSEAVAATTLNRPLTRLAELVTAGAVAAGGATGATGR
jgi:hypothetical protein